jgi:hypothetical protein
MATTEAMTKNSKTKTVAELRATLERLGEERDRYLATNAEAETGIKECARAIFDGDGEANERRKGHRMRRNTARDALEQIDLIPPDLQHELAEAIAAEEQAAREADAAEAQKFADGLAKLFGEVDDHLCLFRQAYAACFSAVRRARMRGWVVPSEEMLQSKMDRALRTAFSVAELRGLDLPPLPAPERTTFAAVGAAYAMGVRGGALHRAKPPAPQPQPKPQQAVKSDDRKLPRQFDVAARMPGDGPDFAIRIAQAR